MAADDPSPATNVTTRVHPPRHLENAFDRRRIGWIRVGQPSADRPPGERQRGAGKCPRIVHIDSGSEIREESFVIGDQVGFACEKRRDIALRDVIQEGDEFMPHTISTESRICIRCIDGDGDATTSTQFVGFGTANREEWLLWRAAHARNAVGTGPTHEVEQHRFGLIIGGVAGQHIRWQGCKARSSRARFEVGAIIERNPVGNEVRSEALTQIGNETSFGR